MWLQEVVNASVEKSYDPITFTQEGCLSFPGRSEDTTRFQEVHVTGNLVEPHAMIATGFLAVAIQHELDHLNSVLFMDRRIVKPPISKKKVGPNDLCLCGSNKKFKRCCGR
jgi:peptide deformylase